MERQLKTKAGQANYRWSQEELEFVVQIFRCVDDDKDFKQLMIDLMTHKEISELIRRTIIASMLSQGLTYTKIAELTGASSNTVSDIRKRFYRRDSVLDKILKSTTPFEVPEEAKTISTIKRRKKRYATPRDAVLGKHSLGYLGKKI